jgi:hypothetical protein
VDGSGPGRYRKKPVVIEARSVPVYAEAGDISAYLDKCTSLAEWCGGISHMMHSPGDEGHDHILISTLEGDMEARPGDWIICGVKGEFYPCKSDIFEATYEPSRVEPERVGTWDCPHGVTYSGTEDFIGGARNAHDELTGSEKEAEKVVSRLVEALAFMRSCDRSGEHGVDSPIVSDALTAAHNWHVANAPADESTILGFIPTAEGEDPRH